MEVRTKYAREIMKLVSQTMAEDLDGDAQGANAVAYAAGYRRARYDAAMMACGADADIASLAHELVQAHNQLLIAADCLEKKRYDEALLHCNSLVRPRRNALGLIGIDV